MKTIFSREINDWTVFVDRLSRREIEEFELTDDDRDGSTQSEGVADRVRVLLRQKSAIYAVFAVWPDGDDTFLQSVHSSPAAAIRAAKR